jgi:hypothetical protein
MYMECRHIKPNGAKCHAPALRGMPYCYFHKRLHRHIVPEPERPREGYETLELGILEDRCAVQLALSKVLDAIGSARLDPRRAGLLLYGLQVASNNAVNHRAIAYIDSVESLTYSADGEELAPESFDCDPPGECSECPRFDQCDNPDRSRTKKKAPKALLDSSVRQNTER